jgi:hypothetical protein
MAMNDSDSDTTVRYCPCCGQAKVLSGLGVSCGTCDLVLSVADAKESWPEEPPEWTQ